MSVSVIIASDRDQSGQRVLRPGDRAALSEGVSLAGTRCRVFTPADDDFAEVYSRSLGAVWAPWIIPMEPTCDLTLIGPGAIQLFGDELAGQLAEVSRAELFFDVLALQRVREIWQVTCDAGRGARDIVQVCGPLVVVVSEHAPRPRYVSRYRLSQVARPVTEVPQVSPSSVAWQPVKPRVRRATGAGEGSAEQRANSAFGIESGSSRTTDRQIVDEEPAVSAQVLLRYLVHHGFVSRSIPPVDNTAVVEAGLSRALAVEPVRVSPSQADAGLARKIARGPRQPTDSVARLARRPHSPPAIASSPGRTIPTRLQRAPRRIDSKTVQNQRGPFPLDAEWRSPTP